MICEYLYFNHNLLKLETLLMRFQKEAAELLIQCSMEAEKKNV